MFTALALTCLAEVAYYEARNQPEPAQFAVIEATLRRVDDWRWDDKPCDVVYAPAQYEWTSNKPVKLIQEKPNWELAKDITGIVVENHLNGEYAATRCSDHFHDESKTPWWVPLMEFEVQIGDILFYCSDEKYWRMQ